MSDEKLSIEELIGLTAEQLEDQVAHEKHLSHILANVGEASPEVLIEVARRVAKQSADLFLDGDTPVDQIRGALSTTCFYLTLLAKRLEHDNPTSLIITE